MGIAIRTILDNVRGLAVRLFLVQEVVDSTFFVRASGENGSILRREPNKEPLSLISL